MKGVRAFIALVGAKSEVALPSPIDMYHSMSRAGTSTELKLIFLTPSMAQDFRLKISELV